MTLLIICCSSNQRKINQIKINVTPDKHSLKITGLDLLIVQDINRDSSGGNWQSLVPVFKMPADTDLKNYQFIQPGKYLVKDSSVFFTPILLSLRSKPILCAIISMIPTARHLILYWGIINWAVYIIPICFLSNNLPALTQ